MITQKKERKESKTLRRLRQQAALTRHAHGVTVEVAQGRMALKIGPFKIWVSGYTIIVRGPRMPPSAVRVRTAKSCGDILRGISMHSLHTSF